MFFSDEYSIIKVYNYFKNSYKQKRNLKKNKIRCTGNKILNPLKNGLSSSEEKYIINVLNDYINEAFLSTTLKKLIIITHPHKKHLSGEYILNINDLVYQAKLQSNYNNKIKIVSFLKNYNDYSIGDVNDIFIENDAYSHLKDNYFLTNILPKVLTEIN